MNSKALISFAVTSKLVCVFVFAYLKIRFSHDAAHFAFNQFHVNATSQIFVEAISGHQAKTITHSSHFSPDNQPVLGPVMMVL